MDFTTTTYSVMMSFVTMATSMTYPLLAQAMQRLDDMYQDDFMIRWFKEEWAFKCFRIMLLVALAFGICVPFAIDTLGCIFGVPVSLVLLFIQTITTVAVVVSSIYVVRLIFTYYETPELLKHFEKRGNGYLSQLVCIMLKSARSKNPDTYNQALDDIMAEIVKCRRGRIRDGGSKSIGMVYPKEYYRAFAVIVDNTVSQQNYEYLRTDNRLTQILYSDGCISNETLRFMWISINRITDADCFEWFRQYWGCATDYTLRFTHIEEKSKADQHFLFTHFVMGALMLYKRKYEWLRFMLDYTPTFPHTYPLVPGNIKDIWTNLSKAYTECDGTMGLCSSYMFMGMANDVRADAKIYKQVEIYAALLMMRLEKLDGEIGRRYDTTGIDKRYMSKEYCRSQCASLRKDMDELAKDNAAASCFGFKAEHARNLLSQIEQGSVGSEITSNDQMLPNYIREGLIESVKRFKTMLPGAKNGVSKMLTQRMRVSSDVMNGKIWSPTLPRQILGELYQRIYMWYESAFICKPATASYVVQYTDIEKALKRLNVDKQYAIIKLGVSILSGSTTSDEDSDLDFVDELKSYSGAMIYSVETSAANSVIVALADLLPGITIGGTPDKKGMECIDSDLGIYAETANKQGDDCELTVGLAVTEDNGNANLKYVRLRIIHDRSLGPCNLDDIKPVSETLSAKETTNH